MSCILRIEGDSLLQCFSYLDSGSICCVATVSTRFHEAIYTNNELWRQLLSNELGVEDNQWPPASGANAMIDEANAARLQYAAWRNSFLGYSAPEIKVAHQWWMRMEMFLEKSCRPIKETLNPPVTEHELNQFEQEIGFKFPRLLKLLYKFHDGQNLIFDKIRFEKITPDRLSVTTNQIHGSIFHGLLGGYTFYDELINMRLLPLSHIRIVTRERRRLLPQARLVPCSAIRGVDDNSDVESPSPSDHSSRHVIFACNALIRSTLEKLFLASDGNGTDCDGVFVNFGNSIFICITCLIGASLLSSDGFEKVMPVCAPPIMRGGGSGTGVTQPGGRLFHWLGEYLRRLEAGVYLLQPLDLTTPQHLMSEEAGNFRMLTLFPWVPVPAPAPAPPGPQPRGAPSTQAPTSASSALPPPLPSTEQDEGVRVTTTVTQGVEVSVAATFIPEKSSEK